MVGCKKQCTMIVIKFFAKYVKYYAKQTPGVQKKCKAKKKQLLKALISNKAKKSVNESAT